MSIYLDLTRQFNAGALRAILSSGQAVVLHRLAIMSKDGDWILREEAQATQHVLQVLEGRGARYRFGAPSDVRWMSGGWSAHLEFATRSSASGPTSLPVRLASRVRISRRFGGHRKAGIRLTSIYGVWRS